MSSPNLTKSRTWLRFAAVLAISAGLASCFQPMYGASTQLGAGPNLRDALREVEVLEVSGRIGQELRNDLIFELTGGQGNPAGAPFVLALSVTSSSQTPLVDVQSGRALSETVTLDVVYSLRDTNNKRVVLTEKALARVTIDRNQQRFAATRAVRDAQNRAAKIVAEQIRSRVASYFLTRT